ncbi:nucleoside-diphosphate sugar epimerase/dehydratase [Novosphingobium sp. BL-8H]|uniref:polysaccharide biosynthesis protein n=1 Tax=Novosphingobium sp. BL-8H TaxID=3127640 RepID=UPI0037579AA3
MNQTVAGSTASKLTGGSANTFLRVRKLGSSNPRSRSSIAQFSLRRTFRNMVLMLLDFTILVSTLALAFTFIGRTGFPKSDGHLAAVLAFAALVIGCFYTTGLYRRSWRYFSFSHAMQLALLTIPAFGLGWAAILLVPGVQAERPQLAAIALAQWLFAITALLAARGSRRALREKLSQTAKSMPATAQGRDLRRAILVGSPDWALSIIDVLKRESTPTLSVVGILLPAANDTLLQIAKVPVLGTHEDLAHAVDELELQGRRPSLVIACDDGTDLSNREMARLTSRSRQMGLELSRIRDGWSHILQRGHGAAPDELSVKDLLGRSEFTLEGEQITSQISGKCVLVTGAGGTIGGELCWQLASFRPSRLVLLEHSEFHLYAIEMKLREQFPDLDVQPELCNIRERDDVRRVFEKHRPTIVYHAAALKHVPIVETNPCAGVHTNIIGTRIVADAVCEFSVKAMVQVSTDKAVNPVGMMGATKRVGELYAQALDMCGVDDSEAPRFMTVRFGNVLGSSGSIVPLFHRQLREGRPLTVTHPDIERFFMTVREAVQLILQSSSAALAQNTRRGTIFVLDMGKPVRIVDLAYRMIRLYGLQPEIDVPVEFVGLRPGEKLFEELFDICEEQLASGIKGIFEAQSKPIPLPFISRSIDRLARAVELGDHVEARRITHTLVKVPSGSAGFELIQNEAMTGPRGSGEPVKA